MDTKARYWTLFAFETVGAIIMLWKGIPIYRNFLSGEVDPGNRVLIWALSVMALIQIPYWRAYRHKLRFSEGNLHSRAGGHAVLFLSRLVFTFVSGLFSAVFYARAASIEFSYRIFLLIALLFSMFCYTLELEKMGRALLQAGETAE